MEGEEGAEIDSSQAVYNPNAEMADAEPDPADSLEQTRQFLLTKHLGEMELLQDTESHLKELVK